jgi:hypothetical protein
MPKLDVVDLSHHNAIKDLPDFCRALKSVGFANAAATVRDLIEARDQQRLLRLQRYPRGAPSCCSRCSRRGSRRMDYCPGPPSITPALTWSVRSRS